MNIEQHIQKLIDKTDSAATYCLGGGLAGFSCVAQQIQPILSDIGILAGVAACGAKAYYDYKKHKKGE